MATHDKHDNESASATSAGDANLQETVDRLQSQLANEVSEVRNFAGIAALVFAAGILFMLAWDTTAVPLEHHMLPARDYETVSYTHLTLPTKA